jgi:nucleoid-associated protein YgaU
MLSRIALITLGASSAAVAAIGAGAYYWTTAPGLSQPALSEQSVPSPVAAERAPPQPVPPPAPKAAPPVAAASAVAAAPPAAPSFDVVSVEPTGDAVIAGRAAANAKVALVDAGRTVAEATADERGQFVMIPAPLAPGEHALTLSTGAATSNVVPVSVAPPPVATASAVPPPAAAVQPAVAIRSVETTAQGGLAAAGSAQPDTVVRLYVSGAYVGDAHVQKDGRWSLNIAHGLTEGGYALRADAIEPESAKVAARAETPFNVPASAVATASSADAAPTPPKTPADVVVDSVTTHHVDRGDTLWGISQTVYGNGARYAVIFSANANQIRDPNLIYPGQTFVLPNGAPPP